MTCAIGARGRPLLVPDPRIGCPPARPRCGFRSWPPHPAAVSSAERRLSGLWFPLRQPTEFVLSQNDRFRDT